MRRWEKKKGIDERRKIRIVSRIIHDENGRLIGSASIQFRVIIEKLENRNDDRRETAINHGHV